MKTKEAIIDSLWFTQLPEMTMVSAEPKAYSVEQIRAAMDEYARSVAIDYMHWCFKKVFPSMTPDNTSPQAEQLFDKYLQEKDKV